MADRAWPDGEGRARALERLIGVRSSKPSFYAAWRDNSARLDRSIETLEWISTALCAAPDGPDALCDAVVEAAAHHFDAPWAAMTFAGGRRNPALPDVIRPVASGPNRDAGPEPETLEMIGTRALAAQEPVLLDADAAQRAVAAPMPVRGEIVGVLAVGLPPDAVVESSDLSILVTLANHAGVALHNAWMFQESERIRRRLEDTGRRQLISQERNRIARELHDSVAQQLLSIGMNLEWCRRHNTTSGAVRERVSNAKSLARTAVDEIRSVIFELASDGHADLRRALHDVIEDVVVGTRLRVGLRTYGQARPLSGAAQHALIQIAREALFNVVRHGGAERAWLMLRWEPAAVRLVIADDGHGDPGALQRQLGAAGPAGRHFGLAGIAERVRELDGTVAFHRRRGGGVRLAVEVPLGGAGAAG
ncbi:MAG TPA: GAF domain-containing sensor histidine kinase [Solirubrobacteraceae bacterium]|nr:GAF domain-containing sensor histidine kinase [Solirubrobacteraceae bacterium]